MVRSELGDLKQDCVFGTAAASIAGLAIWVFVLGQKTQAEAGWGALQVAIAGLAVAECLKRGLTGKHLSLGEALQDLLVSGGLAATASTLPILQAPSSWLDLFRLSQPIATVGIVVYHGVNAYRLASAGRHLGPFGAALIFGTPYAVGSLLLLESGDLLRIAASGSLPAGWAALAELSEFAARVAVVFAFNLAVANAIGLATKRSWLRSHRGTLSLLVVAVAVIAAPRVAAFGSGTVVAAWPTGLRLPAVLLATVISQAGLWAEVYLVTGLILDAIHGRAPSRQSVSEHPVQGLKKAIVYSGTFMGLLNGVDLVWRSADLQAYASRHPLAIAMTLGALIFPLLKTIVETFDGSRAFFGRAGMSYRNPTLYARGAVVGLGMGYAVVHAFAEQSMAVRVWFGFGLGVAAFAGVNFLRDIAYTLRGRAVPWPWRAYIVEAMLGGFIGAAIGFYLDAVQVSVVVGKYHRYLGVGQSPEPFGVYPLLSKWGFINLGQVTGGVGLLFDEALAGVISWAIPAWLFALNRTFMAACFRRETAPIRSLFTNEGLAQLSQNMIEVLRWGLWMSPIINSFLRPVGNPTWYNQDGAIHTVVAVYQQATLSPDAFRVWSLQVFIYLLAYDSVRILIWLDHMGLRVATLVNLSFLGMDKLDEKLARFLGPAATARCIPEGVKRFTTWAPLLIPFYIPRGASWDYAWTQSETLHNAAQGGGILPALAAWPLSEKFLLGLVAVAGATVAVSIVRRIAHRTARGPALAGLLNNTVYEVLLKSSGEVASRATERGYDVSRRCYDRLDPAGRTLFVVDTVEASDSAARAWPVIGNYSAARGTASQTEAGDGVLTIRNVSHGIRTTIAISLPGAGDPLELWTVTAENLVASPRRLKLIPYLEWVLNRADADRGHTQYNRLFAEMEYSSALHAVLAWDKHSQALGILATDMAPEGFLTARADFIGRARSIWKPRIVETLAFCPPHDTAAHPTFDPIGGLALGLNLEPNQSLSVRLVIGLARDKRQAIELIARHLRIPGADAVAADRSRKMTHSIGHGEIPLGTPQPYADFRAEGRRLLVHTPFTPRPYDHTMSNALGHVMVVTNRGLHGSSSVNSQQNRLTPDWPDTVTTEVPAEAFYLFDPEHEQWYCPTYHPLNDVCARHEVEFGVDGTAMFRMSRDTLATELTVFVPPDEPVGVYLLTIKNLGSTGRQLRLAPYFQIVLSDQPEHAGPLKIRYEQSLGAVFFENPRNEFRSGPAFVAMPATVEHAVEHLETQRGRFFGAARNVAAPALVENGQPDPAPTDDDRPVAALLTTLDIPAGAQHTVVVLLGQADDRQQAETVIRNYATVEAAQTSLARTRQWWLSRMDTLRVATNHPALDQYLDWLKYQALAERIWARRGFYQASGAFGFRDQLQDAVNLLWMDPAIARRQIRLHASQQFPEGDVVHWFHLLQDGRTGFAARTHASDNPLWLAWAVAEYVAATGDPSLLEERTPYLEAEQLLEPLPGGKDGMGCNFLRSSRADSIYRHAMKAIDLVLDHRLGSHRLPLIGTGDWNDGLDAIGSQGRGESVWLGFFLYYVLGRMARTIERQDGPARQAYYLQRASQLKDALQGTWREDRYLRAFHDDGSEIGVRGSGIWEIDALTAAWAVMSGIDPVRGRIVFDTALGILEKENTILLGWPPLREDSKPYLGRSSWYPEGVRENGMYCHGVQWLVGAARILAEQCARDGKPDDASRYRETAYRLWLKISPIPHVVPGEIETYGGQPNKQAADMVTTFDPGRMIWHGYTGAAGWLFRQALEGVLGARLVDNQAIGPADPAESIGALRIVRIDRNAILPAGDS
jgi:cyclic beta-1,2-glucan synthetase